MRIPETNDCAVAYAYEPLGLLSMIVAEILAFTVHVSAPESILEARQGHPGVGGAEDR